MRLTGADDINAVCMDEKALDGLRESWGALLVRSEADPLFNSPEWLSAWWQQYRTEVGASLRVIAVQQGNTLVGLAVLYRRRVRGALGRGVIRLEAVGNAWRSGRTAMSERSGFIFSRDHGAAADALAARLLSDPDWDELVVAHTEAGGLTEQVLQHMAAQCGGYLREPDTMDAWEVPLEGTFQDYLASLGAGTRARIIGSRKRLANAGRLRERVLAADELEAGWEVFDSLYRGRWNRPLGPHWREFYDAVATRMRVSSDDTMLSILEFNARPVSAMLNFRAGLREYSVLSAFVTPDVKRVSPGWLHLGVAIERAYADGMKVFDLLGGGGLQEQYKSKLGGRPTSLVCLQLVRRRPMAMALRARDVLAAARRGAVKSLQRVTS